MKEIPMLFKTEMVESILRGNKTQTRRIIKPQPLYGLHNDTLFPRSLDSKLENWNGETIEGESREWKCPYGEVGDVIWVKENYYALGQWIKDGMSPKTGRQKWRFQDETPIGNYGYFDSAPENVILGLHGQYGWHKRPSLFMPKIASRIRLEVTDVFVQRLQNICERDAISEGIEFVEYPKTEFYNYLTEEYELKSPIDSYKSLWESINGEDSWNQNPYVWVIEFENITKKP